MAVAAVAAGFALVPGAEGGDRKFGAFYADCWFSKKSGKLTVKTKNSEEATVRRRSKRIVVLAPKLARCRGGQATVRNTRKLVFKVRPDGITQANLLLAGGPFAPGRGAEPAPPEIEIKVVVPSRNGMLHVGGGGGADVIRGGSLGKAQGLNLNAGSEPAGGDSDLRLTGKGSRSLAVSLAAGDDSLQLSGGSEFAGPMALTSVLVDLGPGSDSYIGTAGHDIVDGGPGPDVIQTGEGDDSIEAADGLADTVDCGGGNDIVSADPADVLIGCEFLGSPDDPHVAGRVMADLVRHTSE